MLYFRSLWYSDVRGIPSSSAARVLFPPTTSSTWRRWLATHASRFQSVGPGVVSCDRFLGQIRIPEPAYDPKRMGIQRHNKVGGDVMAEAPGHRRIRSNDHSFKVGLLDVSHSIKAVQRRTGCDDQGLVAFHEPRLLQG